MVMQTKKLPYQTPKLEQEKSYTVLTGVSLPIGGILSEDEGTEQ